jgi:hypothetical protein
LTELDVISRLDAISFGLKRYFTGKSCKNGHMAERLCSNRACAECEIKRTQKWRLENGEKISLYTAEWKRANPEYKKNWRKNNKDKIQANAALRRAKKMLATPSWLTTRQWEDINLAYSVSNELKLTTGITYHVDHIIPLRGKNVCGLHVPWNLQAIPAVENLKKGTKHSD